MNVGVRKITIDYEHAMPLFALIAVPFSTPHPNSSSPSALPTANIDGRCVIWGFLSAWPYAFSPQGMSQLSCTDHGIWIKNAAYVLKTWQAKGIPWSHTNHGVNRGPGK